MATRKSAIVAGVGSVLSAVAIAALSKIVIDGECPAAFASLCSDLETHPALADGSTSSPTGTTSSPVRMQAAATLALKPSGADGASAQLAATIATTLSQKLKSSGASRTTVRYRLSGLQLAGGANRTVWASWTLATDTASSASCGPEQYRFFSSGNLADRLAVDMQDALDLSATKGAPTCA